MRERGEGGERRREGDGGKMGERENEWGQRKNEKGRWREGGGGGSQIDRQTASPVSVYVLDMKKKIAIEIPHIWKLLRSI